MHDWDQDSSTLKRNLTEAYKRSRNQALHREAPSVELAREWHVTTMSELNVPDQKYVGRFRGETGLVGCEVRIGGSNGVLSTLVVQELQVFEEKLCKSMSVLDELIPKGDTPNSADQLNAVIELAAWVHAEWVRIHPFANGNGRTARIWTAFIAMRYGLPPFVRLRPRPDGGYAAACAKAMEGDWDATAQVFRRMYLDALARKQ
ncbi:MAG: Fic family protein [Pseudomonadota bacterium]